VSSPTSYSDEVAAEIANRIAEGSSLHKIEKDPTMPSARTVIRWCQQFPEFEKLMAHARLSKADWYFDEAISISDEAVADGAQAARQRTRVQARQYAASRLNPARYAEKLALGQAHDLPPLNPPVTLESARRIAFLLQVGLRTSNAASKEVPAGALEGRHE
jgi:hypothetical protein